MSQPVPFDEAIKALKRDPTHAVRVRVDEELTVEVRAVEPSAAPKRSAADAFRELGRWEGETGADFDTLFADVSEATTLLPRKIHLRAKCLVSGHVDIRSLQT